MKTVYDAGRLQWKLAGVKPFQWSFEKSMEIGAAPCLDVGPLPAKVPGSVQGVLREAGHLPDWNVGTNFNACDWVENRHWFFETRIPDAWLRGKGRTRLCCLGLDGPGWLVLNGQVTGQFENSFVPHIFDLTDSLRPHDNVLQIVFGCPPRWLGQTGFTSKMREWKPRFNYSWDWITRLVQIGPWDDIFVERVDGSELAELRCSARYDAGTGRGSIELEGRVESVRGMRLHLRVLKGRKEVGGLSVPASRLSRGLVLKGLSVAPWWPAGEGAQPLYRVEVVLKDAAGKTHDRREYTVGFRTVEWRPCLNAPPGADPWICAVNGRSIFLQGVNWTPIRPNFADVGEDDYRARLETYRDLGVNILRVWGGAVLEKECFYRLCDELGLLVWQELPLSSSGPENWPPDDEKSIADMEAIAGSYITRRGHHASLLMWCGGNELQTQLDGKTMGTGRPIDFSHPMMARVKTLMDRMDPGRRFVATSASGPRFTARPEAYGKGLHWDVHGPWQPETESYWRGDDALFRSEVGAAGASSADVIRAFKGEFPEMPATIENRYWRRNSHWWLRWKVFVQEHGREPRDLEEYVAWSQREQAEALERAARSCKSRFPQCGGMIVWMGHDACPCPSNTSILDYFGRCKPAAHALARVFRERPPADGRSQGGAQ